MEMEIEIVARAFVNFIQLLSNRSFEVVSRTAGAATRQRGTRNDENDAPEPPLEEPISSRVDCETALHTVVLVGLRSNVTFQVVARFHEQNGTLTDKVLSVRTVSSHSQAVQLRHLLTTDHFDILSHSEVCNAVVSQPTDWMLMFINWRQKAQVIRTLSRLYYEGLFTLPDMRVPNLLSLPNGVRRYVIDFQQCTDGCWTRSKKIRKNVARLTTADPFRERAQTETSAPTEGCKSKRRQLRVIVNEDFGASLRRALAYHGVRGGATWITDDLVSALELMSVAGKNAHGVQLCAVELVDEQTREVLAGCIGFAIGSVYHDFTMYTAVRCSESYGTLVTNVLGAALQDCGYRLWYWGFRVDYMASYEADCGAAQMDRRDFYSVWNAARDELPIWHIVSYINESRGLLMALTKDT